VAVVVVVVALVPAKASGYHPMWPARTAVAVAVAAWSFVVEHDAPP